MSTNDESVLTIVLDSLKGFARRHFPDELALALDREGKFPEEIITRMMSGELGLHLVFIPEEHGGLGAGAADIARFSEEMARIDLGLATSFLAVSLGTDPILVGGTDEQKKKWLGRIAEGILVGYAVTEPGAGSDLTLLKTRAEKLPGGGYRIDGVKQFITNGGVASLFTVLAMAPGGPSFFVVEGDRPGLSRGKEEDKHGIRASNTTQVTFEGVEIPADHLIGGVEGQGLAQAGKVFGYTRLMVAAFGLGAGEEALRRAVAYGRDRVQYGTCLLEKPGLMHRLTVPALVRLEAARAYIHSVATRLDRGEGDLAVEGAMAKLFASEAGNQAADVAVQMHGGYGYTREYIVEKIRRDVRITTIYEGTSEMLRLVVFRDRWGRDLQERGKMYERLADEAGAQSGDPKPAEGHGAQSAAAGEEKGQRDPVGLARLSSGFLTLSRIMNVAREFRLTRNQSVMFRLADLMTALEVGLVFSHACAGGPQHLQAMARLHARDCLKLAVGTWADVVCGAASRPASGNPPGAGIPANWADEMSGLEDDLGLVSGWIREH